jgi:hypothetical protein
MVHVATTTRLKQSGARNVALEGAKATRLGMKMGLSLDIWLVSAVRWRIGTGIHEEDPLVSDDDGIDRR